MKVDLHYLKFMCYCMRISKNGRLYAFGFVFFALSMAVFESLGIFAFVPLLETITSSDFSQGNFALKQISRFIGGETVNERLLFIAIFILLVSVIRATSEYFARVFSAGLSIVVNNALNAEAFDYLLAANIPYVERHPMGTLRNNILQLPGRIAQVVQQTAMIVMASILLLFYFSLMLAISGPLSLLALVLVFAIFLLSQKLSKFQKRFGHELTEVGKALAQLTFDVIQTMKLVRLSGAEPRMREKLKAGLQRKISTLYRINLVNAAGQPVFTVAGGTFVALSLITGTLIYGETSHDWVAFLVIYLLILYRLMGPISQVNTARLTIAAHLEAVDLYKAFIDECQMNRQPTGSHLVAEPAACMELNGVAFSYPERREVGLTNITGTIKQGQMTAIVGRSGSGKTTLINLLAKLIEPNGGEVLIDGVPIQNLNTRQWMDRIGFVPQDLTLYNDTIEANIRFAHPEATDAELWDAIRSADLEALITSLPNGLKTKVGEMGSHLSGGERQRIAIARALLEKADIIVLDEATSQLDSISDHAIQSVIEKLRGRKTIIVIAHRLATVTKADQIWVMEGGRICQRGTHAALMAEGGLYRKLIEHQEISDT